MNQFYLSYAEFYFLTQITKTQESQLIFIYTVILEILILAKLAYMITKIFTYKSIHINIIPTVAKYD